MTGPAPWWRGAVIYQIYPSSFADGNGDGVGDLIGAAARLEHVASLGADAAWVSPIYPSGGVDGGYDVTDYLDVDPAFGGMSGFEAFRDEAHRLGLRVVLDFVPSHTSDRHPWFVQSRSSRTDAKRSWYIWADGREGGPPNNWISTFGGPAWQWDEHTEQFFLTSFYPEQVDLDWYEPGVRQALTDAMKTWVDRGVDGFRLDVVQRLGKDRLLRSNPPPEPGASTFDEDQPEGHEHVRAIRRAVGQDTMLLGEVWLLDTDLVLPYVAPDQLDLAFNFPFAMARWNARAMAALIERVESRWTEAWPCYHLSNHDMSRIRTRFGPEVLPAAAVLLLTLRGTAQLYQGDEIGMGDGPVPPERRRDQVGRDGCRTPMQWDGSANAGFCPPGAEPWLPVAPDHDRVNVEVEADDPDSLLHLYRRLIELRRRSRALLHGRFGLVGATRDVLLYRRDAADERFMVAVGFERTDVSFQVPPGRIEVATSRGREGERVGGTCLLGAREALVIRLDQTERTA